MLKFKFWTKLLPWKVSHFLSFKFNRKECQKVTTFNLSISLWKSISLAHEKIYLHVQFRIKYKTDTIKKCFILWNGLTYRLSLKSFHVWDFRVQFVWHILTDFFWRKNFQCQFGLSDQFHKFEKVFFLGMAINFESFF